MTFILSLHGGGSYGNWQRHYFPILDYVDKYRLVVATPFSRMFVDVNRRRDDFEHLDGEVRSRRGVVRTHTMRAYAEQAGYRDVEIVPIEHDFWRFYRLDS